MNDAELRAQLTRRGLARVADELMRLAAPTVRVYIQAGSEADIPIGASKLGGRPDLPDGVAWPAWHEPMAFIAQFDLAAVAPHDRAGDLPAHGLLSFFYETDGEPLYLAGWGLPAGTDPAAFPEIAESLGWRVLYHAGDPAAFVRREIPAALNERVRFPACAARFVAEVSLPDVDGPGIASLRLSEAERSALIDLDLDVNLGSWEAGAHRLLGYPYNYASSTLLECELAARRIPHDWMIASPARRRQLEQDAAHRWRLLLQVGSSDDAAMDWAGGGVLHFCIERDALPRRDFPRVWVNMQFL